MPAPIERAIRLSILASFQSAILVRCGCKLEAVDVGGRVSSMRAVAAATTSDRDVAEEARDGYVRIDPTLGISHHEIQGEAGWERPVYADRRNNRSFEVAPWRLMDPVVEVDHRLHEDIWVDRGDSGKGS